MKAGGNADNRRGKIVADGKLKRVPIAGGTPVVLCEVEAGAGVGATWGRDPLGAPSQGLLRDIGFGLRFGNSRSARGNVLHFDVAVPLDGDRSLRNVQYLIETKKSF